MWIINVNSKDLLQWKKNELKIITKCLKLALLGLKLALTGLRLALCGLRSHADLCFLTGSLDLAFPMPVRLHDDPLKPQTGPFF